MGLIKYIFQDWKVNSTDKKGRFVLLWFRISYWVTSSKMRKLLFFPVFLFNKYIVHWILGVEIGWRTKIGKNCRIFHGVGLVINSDTIIGENCTFRQGVTIGNKLDKNGIDSASPVIGNNVEFGANACAIGGIKIGNNVVIGAGCIVVKDVPDNSIAVGNPARIIKIT
ncbi:serine O-acetyltransferase [Flavobacterium psychrotrophum]|uniref:serine O-acetyltransferase n=1 Tax=Flavobacterium psychrotrophum TaxID=2294119 RepID=UPI000E322857|nr:DapH/DapD/GlmU-related protein [Flavobacterium psychrotrophum]